MKKLILTISLLCLTLMLTKAQAPQAFNYQAVARDASGNLISNQNIGLQFSILQGSSSGTIMFTETHAVTTEQFGLFTVSIGTGTVTFGTFGSIPWNTGLYWLKVEMDPLGGTAYTEMGSSQLLSVPYAMNAQTAVSVTGTVTETDPVFGTSVASGITGTDTASWNNKLDSYTEMQALYDVVALDNNAYSQIKNVINPTQPQDAATKAYVDLYAMPGGSCEGEMLFWNGSEWKKVNPGSNGQQLTFCNNVPVWTTGGVCPPGIGESYGGGIVAYIFECGDPGFVPGETHGIIAAPSDQSTGIEWGCYGTLLGASGAALGSGTANTTIIVNGCSTANIAAKVCDNLSLSGYNDWCLPSVEDLGKLHLNRNVIGGFDEDYGYWSSTEFNSSGAYVQMFSEGTSPTSFNKGNGLMKKVRAIRYF